MDDYLPTHNNHGRSPSPNDETGAKVARHVALKRQKEELRRERDRLLLDLAKGLGQPRMAQLLGVKQQDVGKLLTDARTRLDASQPELASLPGGEITVRRLRARQKAPLTTAAASNDMTSEPSSADELRERASQVARPGGPRVVERRNARPERVSNRWADADAYYQALGAQSLGNG